MDSILAHKTEAFNPPALLIIFIKYLFCKLVADDHSMSIAAAKTHPIFSTNLTHLDTLTTMTAYTISDAAFGRPNADGTF